MTLGIVVRKYEWMRLLAVLGGSFVLGSALHFAVSTAVGWLYGMHTGEFLVVAYSIALGLGNTLAFNALAGALLFIWTCFGSAKLPQNWWKPLALVSLLPPLAPLVDWLLHLSGLVPYVGYVNTFSGEFNPLERIGLLLTSFQSDADPRITLGHRVYFFLSAVILGFASFRATSVVWRAGVTSVGAFLSFYVILALFSPSNVPPESLFLGNALLALVAWVAAAWIFSRSYSPRQDVTPVLAENSTG
jgi:hypothetical protein